LLTDTTSLRFVRAKNLRVEWAAYYDGTIASVANLNAVKLEVKYDTDRAGASLMSQTLTLSDLDDTTDDTTFTDGTKQHGAFEFTYLETALPMKGQTERVFWLVITATNDSVPAEKIPLLQQRVTVYESGGETTVPNVVAGVPGASPFVYVGYAENTSGLGFSESPGTNRDYIAFRTSDSIIYPVSSGTFSGLWKQYASSAGGGGGGGGYITVQDEGSALTQRTVIDFVGLGVSAADSGGKTVVTIPQNSSWTVAPTFNTAGGGPAFVASDDNTSPGDPATPVGFLRITKQGLGDFWIPLLQ
jgi:hypothetical protein